MDTISKLFLISFLDTLCLGIIVPALPATILKQRGSHFFIGLITSGSFLGSLASTTIIDEFQKIYGVGYSLLLSLFGVIVLSFILLLTRCNIFFFVAKIYLACVNRTDLICKRLLNDEEDTNNNYAIIDLLSIAGMVIGPLLCGPLYKMSDSIALNAFIALAVMGINCYLVWDILKDSEQHEAEEASDYKSYVDEKLKNFNEQVNFLIDPNNKEYWPIFITQSLLLTGCIIHATKFALLLTCSCRLDLTLVCYTIAYQNMIDFCVKFLIPKIEPIMKKNYWMYVSSVITLALLLCAICFASTWDFYLLMYVPLAITKNIVKQFWDKQINNRAYMALTIILNTTVPIVFGVAFDIFKVNTFYFMIVILAGTIGASVWERTSMEIDYFKED